MTKLHMMMVTAVAATAAMAMPHAASAQQRARSDSLPRDLVEALLRPGGGSLYGGGTDFFVGKLPPAIEPYLYVPRGARVLGGMTSITGLTAVLLVPPGAEDVTAVFQRELPKLGWT